MRGKRTTGVSALVLVGLMVAGCGGGTVAESEPTSPAETTPADAHEDDVARDAAACEAVSDVMTIVENADIALNEGRMAAQEQQGWYEVAIHTLDRIPSTGDGAVSQGVADLKNAGPAVDSWTRSEPVVINWQTWGHAIFALDGPCLAVDAQLATSVFTGG